MSEEEAQQPVTPTQDDAMAEPKTDSKSIKVDVLDVTGPPMHAKLAHILAILVSGVITLAVGTVLADGTSVIKLKDVEFLPRATDPSLVSKGIDYRLDELLGPTYGIGLHHDQSGRTWTEIGAGATVKELVQNLGVPVVAAALPSVIATDGLKHPVPLLACDDLQMAGLAAVSLGFIAEAVAVLMILFHSLALAGVLPAKPAKILGALVWLVLTIGFVTVCAIATGVYTATWHCDNTVIPSIVISDHFDFSYGFYFAITGAVSSLLIFLVVVFVTSTTDGVPGVPVSKPSVLGLLCGIVAGAVLLTGLTVVIAGANKGFEPKPDPLMDPDVNPCQGAKPKHAAPGDKYFVNTACFKDSVAQTLEQAGANVTRGFVGEMDAGNRVPITTEYSEAGLCPVNVHWHLGAEHLSVGEFDELGKGPYNPYAHTSEDGYAAAERPDLFPDWNDNQYSRRKLGASSKRLGHRCRHYDNNTEMYTKPFSWQHCEQMVVGETYEIHWPHSAAGACGTEWQYQTPFYDGVFCRDGVITIAPLNTYEKIGVQSQVFTIVNSDAAEYQYDNLIDGAWTGPADKWSDVAKYTGSTTGTSRDNYVCSRYTPVTWQVDRKCHRISAASFDKLCADMKTKSDDMHGDLHAHGSRLHSDPRLVANNQQSRK